MRRIALLLALAPLATPVSAHAQVASAAAIEVEIPFAPPLDTVQRFRITGSKTIEGQPAVKVSWVEEMRFVRAGDGFILHWRMDPAALPPEMRDASVAPMVAPFTGTPIAFDLNSDGTPVRVRDWDMLRPKMLELVDRTVAVMAEGEEDKVQSAQIAAQVRSMFEGLDAEAATGMLLKNSAPLLRWGETAFALGKTVTDTRDQPVPVFGASLLQTVRATMTALDPGKTATITIKTETDPDSLKAFAAKAVQQFGPADDAETKARVAEEMAKLAQLSVVDETRVVLDLPTGLPRTLTNRRLASVAGIKRTEDLAIEWLR